MTWGGESYWGEEPLLEAKGAPPNFTLCRL